MDVVAERQKERELMAEGCTGTIERGQLMHHGKGPCPVHALDLDCNCGLTSQACPSHPTIAELDALSEEMAADNAEFGEGA